VLGITFFLLTGFGKLPRQRRISNARSVKRSWRVPTAWIASVIARNGPAGWPLW
jgi:hypothetical protein